MDCLTELKNNSHWIWVQELECSASCWYRTRFPPCGPLYSTRRTVWEERDRCRSFYSTFSTFIYFYLFPLPCQSLSTAVRYHHSPFETLFIPAFFFSSRPRNMHTTPTNTQQQVCSFPPLRTQCGTCVCLVPGCCKAASICSTECREGDKEGNDPCHGVEDSVSESLGRHKQIPQK